MQEQLTFKTTSGTIHCESCENRIATTLGRLPGVTTVRASANTQEIEVRFDAAQVAPEQLEARLAEIGFPAKRT